MHWYVHPSSLNLHFGGGGDVLTSVCKDEDSRVPAQVRTMSTLFRKRRCALCPYSRSVNTPAPIKTSKRFGGFDGGTQENLFLLETKERMFPQPILVRPGGWTICSLFKEDARGSVHPSSLNLHTSGGGDDYAYVCKDENQSVPAQMRTNARLFLTKRCSHCPQPECLHSGLPSSSDTDQV